MKGSYTKRYRPCSPYVLRYSADRPRRSKPKQWATTRPALQKTRGRGFDDEIQDVIEGEAKSRRV